MENTEKQKKLTLLTLILMIFTSVFGFANMPRSYYLMGYGAIPWFILGAITFFIPYAFMMAEYGAAFKDEKGGIYSWMEKSVGPKFAFVGIFMWYASYIIWMTNICSTIWIPLSNTIFGVDITSTWSLLGLSSTKTIGILGSIWVTVVFLISKKGMSKITKFTSIGGIACALLNVVLIVGACIVLILNKGQLAEQITSTMSFVNSPNPAYSSTSSMLSFLVFAIFAFGGIEAVGGLVDQTENAEKTFPKGITIAAVVISIGYSLGIFCVGVFTKWSSVLVGDNVNMANVAYVVMNNLGFTLGNSLGLSNSICIQMGNWVARFVGLSMFLSLTGAFFTLSYAPLKQLIEGTPAKLWPGKMAEIDESGMPINAMIIQTIIVVVMVLLISMGGKNAKAFFEMLILMTNVAMTLPYLFLSTAFISFKKKDSILKPFVVFKNKNIAVIVAVIVTATVGFANIFTIIEPSLKGDYTSTIVMIAGPVVFTILALIIHYIGSKK
ncbi:glutamate/gamma-aminobutyrate family transporter YjeM [Clostridium saccharobutylicum]|uniref:Inner membrane transporter YjeM n=1 Tax=Clostridium saccharobutylicum DSM 13864 TaxID=1345695 RepID=U5MSK9_CLOSA|nr:glutamate/gamma-aminobutyrate family transporter YjeM [Clostridium saccharobutylicum]AGX43595.1 inner membrane transporter YjeM [Clostridium saccharobutylicum DSM 13864]AQR90893.1 inner membrane transporter YjeM [Clostridium saccharobutylicum]AQS00797.1 inner membrane transporter YjeM [Clostridium saccharobutylicum]AQS10460.1 inner membrane transporter YjeM [Clostridium saccharobutylicum]AQS14780.1 inner membrane transporter YjeM [Clostridium saccharobutylicum]